MPYLNSAASDRLPCCSAQGCLNLSAKSFREIFLSGGRTFATFLPQEFTRRGEFRAIQGARSEMNYPPGSVLVPALATRIVVRVDPAVTPDRVELSVGVPITGVTLVDLGS